jgi:diamine N-acetyltransferase
LVNALAEYEKLSAMSHPDPHALARHLAEDASPRCDALIVEIDGEPAGFALTYPSYSTFLTGWGVFLEDLFVRPEFRKRGVGLALLRAVARDTLRLGGRRLEWNVLTWNRLALDFYRKIGAEPMSDWQLMRLSGPALESMAGEPVD